MGDHLKGETMSRRKTSPKMSTREKSRLAGDAIGRMQHADRALVNARRMIAWLMVDAISDRRVKTFEGVFI